MEDGIEAPPRSDARLSEALQEGMRAYSNSVNPPSFMRRVVYVRREHLFRRRRLERSAAVRSVVHRLLQFPFTDPFGQEIGLIL